MYCFVSRREVIIVTFFSTYYGCVLCHTFGVNACIIIKTHWFYQDKPLTFIPKRWNSAFRRQPNPNNGSFELMKLCLEICQMVLKGLCVISVIVPTSLVQQSKHICGPVWSIFLVQMHLCSCIFIKLDNWCPAQTFQISYTFNRKVKQSKVVQNCTLIIYKVDGLDNTEHVICTAQEIYSFHVYNKHFCTPVTV